MPLHESAGAAFSVFSVKFRCATFRWVSVKLLCFGQVVLVLPNRLAPEGPCGKIERLFSVFVFAPNHLLRQPDQGCKH